MRVLVVALFVLLAAVRVSVRVAGKKTFAVGCDDPQTPRRRHDHGRDPAPPAGAALREDAHPARQRGGREAGRGDDPPTRVEDFTFKSTDSR
jgi:hypothetical protein